MDVETWNPRSGNPSKALKNPPEKWENLLEKWRFEWEHPL
jgi:hypothetical protein